MAVARACRRATFTLADVGRRLAGVAGFDFQKLRYEFLRLDFLGSRLVGCLEHGRHGLQRGRVLSVGRCRRAVDLREGEEHVRLASLPVKLETMFPLHGCHQTLIVAHTAP